MALGSGIKLGIALALIVSAILFIGIKNPGGSQQQAIPDSAQKTDKSGFLKAPELRGIAGYINTDSNISISGLRGKVILVDFWTFSCINCIRTLPHLKSWDEKYSGKGLVIIGVHSPEFEFEKDYGNVKEAVEKYGLKYAVVQDNDFETWRAYRNQFWPHKFLIDSDGYIRYDHIGEGGYEETEQKIIELLAEKNSEIGDGQIVSSGIKENTDFSKIGTPEIYLGYGFARQQLGNPGGLSPEKTVNYSFPDSFEENTAYLDGNWFSANDFARLESEKGRVAIAYTAKNLNIVAGSPNGSKIKVMLDGKEITENDSGNDAIKEKNEFLAPVKEQRLYNLVSSNNYARHTIIFEVEGKGFELYTFTFG